MKIPRSVAHVANLLPSLVATVLGIGLILRDGPLVSSGHAATLDVIGFVIGIVLLVIAVAAVVLVLWARRAIARASSDDSA